MKQKLMLFVLVLIGFGLYKVQAQSLTSKNIRYESGVVWVQNADDVKVSLQNFDSVSHNYRVVIYDLTTGSMVSVQDTGTLSMSSNQDIHVDRVVSASSPDDLSVEITADSDKIIPSLYVVPGVGMSGVFPPRFWLSPQQLSKFKQQF